MCSKRCKASHEQGRYCRATDFQDPSNPSTIVGHVVVSVSCMLGLAFSPVYVKTAGFPCFTSLRALNCLYLPCFALKAQLQSSPSGMEGRNGIPVNTDWLCTLIWKRVSAEPRWIFQKPAAYFLKACTEFWANPSTFKLKCTRKISSPKWVAWFEQIALYVLHFSLFSSIAKGHVLLLLTFWEARTWYYYFCNGLS